MIIQSNMLRQIGKSARGTISAHNASKLAAGGIDFDMAVRIHNAFTTAGKKEGGVWWANTAVWKDQVAAEAFRAALARDVDRTIITPGQEKPLWMSREWGKMLGQFKSFGFASVQRTMISGLQESDRAAASGALLMMALGMGVHILKMELSGRGDQVDYDNHADLMINALDRSGLMGYFMDVNNTVEKLTRGNIGLSFFSGRPVGRYATRNWAGALLGPTPDFIEDFGTIMGAAFEGDIRATDVHKMRKTIPYNNIFYMRYLFDQMEEGMVDYFDLPETNKRRKAA